MPVRVLVVDDHPAVGQALTMVIGSDARFELAGVALSLSDGLRICAERPVDVVVLDLTLPDASGPQGPLAFRAQTDAKIVIYSAMSSLADQDAVEHADAAVRKGLIDPLLDALAAATAPPTPFARPGDAGPAWIAVRSRVRDAVPVQRGCGSGGVADRRGC